MSDVLGRDEELEVLSGFLDAPPGSVVIEGRTGIGKTTLWRWTLDEAGRRGYRTLAARPTESEAQLSFAGLRDLVEQAFPDVEAGLPSPQRRALAVALLLEDPTQAPDAGTVAAGLLTALRILARERPLLVAVDDVQWLDRPSAAALEFAARRIERERIVLAAARRVEVPAAPPLGLPEDGLRVAVGPLALGALHALLRERLGRPLPRPLLRRFHEASGGNPFLAIELARALERRGGHVDPGEPLPLPPTAEELLEERLATLPASSRDVLLAVAALSHPTSALVAAAAGSAADELERCASAQVIERDGERIRFVHPLLSAAVYAAADPERRRRLHLRLADVVGDAEERARHLALATVRPDARVAAELERAATLARARGAPAAAAELGESAVRLTSPGDGVEALRRVVDAAAYAFEAGDAGKARSLLERALQASEPGGERAEVLVRLGRVRGFGDDVRAAAELYRAAAREPGASDETRIEAEAGLATALMRLLDDLPRAARHARTAVRIARIRDRPRSLAEHMARQALVETLLGRTGALALARRAADVDARAAGSGEPGAVLFLRGLDAGLMLGVSLAFREHLAEARAEIDAARARAEELGDESSLPLLLRYAAYVAWLEGDWTAAARAASEGYDLAAQTGQLPQQGVLAGTQALVAAHLGKVEEARIAAGEAFRISAETGVGLGFGALLGGWGLGVLELSVGNPAAAHERLGPLLDRLEAAGVREPGVVRFAADEIEALVVLGRLEQAEALLERTEQRAEKLGRRGVLALCARCRGLLAGVRRDPEASVAVLERALAGHDHVRLPFEQARTLLALGTAYRRAKQRRLARESLSRAVSQLDALGAAAWAERARTELARVGGRARADGLTATERRVAELVAEGLSNKQVAAALFVAPKTVDVTLSRIYGKLHIHSRLELARQLSKL